MNKPSDALVMFCQMGSGLIFGLTAHWFLQWVSSFKGLAYLSWLGYLILVLAVIGSIRLLWQLAEFYFEFDGAELLQSLRGKEK